MASTLPPDPYKLLGVSKDAKLPEIRSAHRKLVLKCHPDKVQDAALKAIKQDEFQQVQQAYELLSDETRRLAYDDQVKLFELRKEMGRGNPTARSNPFEYEIKTAEPRPNSYSKSSPKVYTYPTTVPRSHEDVYIHADLPRHFPKKSSSYEDKDRKRAVAREEERQREMYAARKHAEDERIRQEKERERRIHSEKKKTREKERRRGTEEKRTRTSGAYVEDDTDDDTYRSPPRPSEKKSSRYMEEEARESRAAEAARAQIKPAPLDPKWDSHMGQAEKYILQSNQQSNRRNLQEDGPHPGMRRAETYTAPSPTYNIRYAVPGEFSDEDLPRRSSARAQGRRSSETPPTRRKSSRERRRSPPVAHPNAHIVEPPSPPPMARMPSLQTYSSAPPQLFREKPIRSKTQDYPRKEIPISLPRAHTFQEGDAPRQRDTRSGSRLKKEFVTSGSDSDTPVYSSPPKRHSHSPTRGQTRYVVENGRSFPSMSRHRSELRELNLNDDYGHRERSESPTSRLGRPPLSRNPPSGDRHTRSHSTSYGFQPVPDAPRVVEARPNMPSRESGSGSYRVVPKYVSEFDKINYTTRYGADHVVYSNFDGYGSPNSSSRRGGGERDYRPSMRGGGVFV